MSAFVASATPLAGVHRIQRQRVQDARGFLSRLFCADDLAALGWRDAVAQVNHTRTERRGSVRGLHFQRPPCAEMKLVSCLRGEVWDVAVDLRRGSPTFLHWHAERLSAEGGEALLIPQGCAHGFQTLTDAVEMLYCHSAAYAPDAEGALHPLDPKLAIAWPLPVGELSARDASHAFVDDAYPGLPA